MKKKANKYVLDLCDELLEKLKKHKIKEIDFLRASYFDIYKNAEISYLDSYIDRNKISNLKQQQRPDKVGLFLLYFDGKFISESEREISRGDIDAAFVFDTEVASRVTTRSLDDDLGCDHSALNSIYSLYGTHRWLIQTLRASCANYRKSVEPYLEGTISPFLSKWHVPVTSQEYDKQDFRHDLRTLQEASRRFLEHFRTAFSI